MGSTQIRIYVPDDIYVDMKAHMQKSGFRSMSEAACDLLSKSLSSPSDETAWLAERIAPAVASVVRAEMAGMQKRMYDACDEAAEMVCERVDEACATSRAALAAAASRMQNPERSYSRFSLMGEALSPEVGWEAAREWADSMMAIGYDPVDDELWGD